jgi:hypothetical protein
MQDLVIKKRSKDDLDVVVHLDKVFSEIDDRSIPDED